MDFQGFLKHREEHQDYKVFWRSGYAFRGARELEVNTGDSTFIEEMKRKFEWACVVDVDEDNPTTKELHLNGLSVLDME